MSANDLPENVLESAEEAIHALIPSKSKVRYEKCYSDFKDWQQFNNCAEIVNEKVLLAYFQQLSKKHSASSLWVYYSMLRSTIMINKNIDIKSFSQLYTFLKRKNVGHVAKKAKVLTSDNLNNFLKDAGDDQFLMCKVVAIFGLFGATRCDELYKLSVNDVRSEGNIIVVTINQTKTYKSRMFTVVPEGSVNNVDIVMKYKNLRPRHTPHNNFFVFYNRGKCSTQKVGIHKISSVPKLIATFLGLSEPEKYTGHSLKRSSATLLADKGANITDLKRLGAWKSSTIAESYVEESVEHKISVARKMVDCETSSSTSENKGSTIVVEGSSGISTHTEIAMSKGTEETANVSISGCTSCTMNIHNYYFGKHN